MIRRLDCALPECGHYLDSSDMEKSDEQLAKSFGWLKIGKNYVCNQHSPNGKIDLSRHIVCAVGHCDHYIIFYDLELPIKETVMKYGWRPVGAKGFVCDKHAVMSGPGTKSNETLGEQEIRNRFGSHVITNENGFPLKDILTETRAKFIEMAQFLDSVLVYNREKEQAILVLEDAAMWAIKSITRHAPLSDEIFPG